MKLIIGLGNIGSEYKNTRHNFGFIALDFFQKENPDFSPWQNSEKFKTELSEGQINNEKIILAKPETMMNLSGRAAKLIADFYKIPPEDILILHDDIDLPLGKIKISQGSSSGGHKGIESLIKELGTKNFIRFRLGIAPQGMFASLKRKLTPTEKFVLRKFGSVEKKTVEEITKKASEAIKIILAEGISKTQSKFN